MKYLVGTIRLLTALVILFSLYTVEFTATWQPDFKGVAIWIEGGSAVASLHYYEKKIHLDIFDGGNLWHDPIEVFSMEW